MYLHTAAWRLQSPRIKNHRSMLCGFPQACSTPTVRHTQTNRWNALTAESSWSSTAPITNSALRASHRHVPTVPKNSLYPENTNKGCRVPTAIAWVWILTVSMAALPRSGTAMPAGLSGTTPTSACNRMRTPCIFRNRCMRVSVSATMTTHPRP